MDFDLTDEQRLIQDTAREFADRELADRARENDRNEHFDTELVAKIAEQGYLGAIVPQEYGGAGLDYGTYAVIVEEVGRGCSAMRTVVSVQTSLVCSSILRWASEEQKRHYLPRLCSGEWLGCFGLTEPRTGSDAAEPRPRGGRTGRGGALHGRMGLHGSDTASLTLDDVEVDDDALLGEVGEWFRVAMTALDSGRPSVA